MYLNNMDRRELLLKEMGISRWQLYRPEVLQGTVGISISSDIRFIIVSDEALGDSSLLDDVLRSLMLTKEDYIRLSFEQIQYIECTHPVLYWLLTEDKIQFEQTLSFCEQADAIYHSPNWATFQSTPKAKQALWVQIQKIK